MINIDQIKLHNMTVTYSIGNNILIDFVTENDEYCGYMYEEGGPIKLFMFRLPKTQYSHQQAIMLFADSATKYLEDYYKICKIVFTEEI